MSPDPQKNLSPEDLALIQRVADEVVSRRLDVPAIFLLESLKPLSFIGSQAMHFFAPMVSAFYSAPIYDRLARLLERREVLELLIQRIEASEGPSAPPTP